MSTPTDELNPIDILTNENVGITDFTQIGNISTLVGFILNIFIGLGIAVILVCTSFAFVGYITSSGDPKQLEKNNNYLIFSLIGLVIVILSWTVRSAILFTLGVDVDFE